MSGVVPWHRTVVSCPCDSTTFSQHCVFGMVLSLTLTSCPGIDGWVLVSTGQTGVRGHNHCVLYTWQCIHSHILAFSDGCIQWICLKIKQRWKPDSREPGIYTKSSPDIGEPGQRTASQQTWFHQLRNELVVIVNGDAPGLCGWPEPGPFACTALPVIASENVWEGSVPRPSHQKFNKVTGCVPGKGATSLSPLSHGLGLSPGWCDRGHRMCFSQAMMQLVLI